jgi:precorrin-3B synthase
MVPYVLLRCLAMPRATTTGLSCPSVDHVLAREDGGLARIRVPGGRIDAGRLDAVARSAERWGSGVVEITNRANLQLRGIRAESAGALAEELIAEGVSGGELADRRRNILLDPLGDRDPEAMDLDPVLEALLAGLDAERRLDGLDDKFGFALDGGGCWSIAGRKAAVVVTPAEARGGVEVCCGWVPDGEDGSATRPRQVALDDLVAALVAAAVDSLDRRRTSLAVPTRAARPEAATRVAGPLGAADGWAGAMPVLGRVDAVSLGAIAAAARRYSRGLLRLTPWRGVVFPGVAAADAGALLRELEVTGLVVDPSDPAATVVACAGARGCTSGLTDAIGDARRLIAAEREAGRQPAALHVSGCHKCCAQHSPLPLTLIGSGPDRYDVYADGELRASGVDAGTAVAVASRS